MGISRLAANVVAQADFSTASLRIAILLGVIVALFVAAFVALRVATARQAKIARSAPDAGSDHTSSTSWLQTMKAQAGAGEVSVDGADITPTSMLPSAPQRPAPAPTAPAAPVAPPASAAAASNAWVDEPTVTARAARPATFQRPAAEQAPPARTPAPPATPAPVAPAGELLRPTAPASNPFGATQADDAAWGAGSDE